MKKFEVVKIIAPGLFCGCSGFIIHVNGKYIVVTLPDGITKMVFEDREIEQVGYSLSESEIKKIESDLGLSSSDSLSFMNDSIEIDYEEQGGEV